MATTVSLAGTNYSIPAYSDSGWAQGSGNLSSYLIAIASVTLQTSGGTFTLTADVNFGSSYGILAKYLTSVTSSPATTGFIRLAAADTISWGASNYALGVSGTNLQWLSQNILVNALSSYLTERRETYIAGTALNNYTGSLTLINLVNPYTANMVNLKVYVNGLLNAVTLDYTETSTSSFTFSSSLITGDRIDAVWSSFS